MVVFCQCKSFVLCRRKPSGPRATNPYSEEDNSSMLPVFVAIGAFIPLVFCLCKLWSSVANINVHTPNCEIEGRRMFSRQVLLEAAAFWRRQCKKHHEDYNVFSTLRNNLYSTRPIASSLCAINCLCYCCRGSSILISLLTLFWIVQGASPSFA